MLSLCCLCVAAGVTGKTTANHAGRPTSIGILSDVGVGVQENQMVHGLETTSKNFDIYNRCACHHVMLCDSVPGFKHHCHSHYLYLFPCVCPLSHYLTLNRASWNIQQLLLKAGYDSSKTFFCARAAENLPDPQEFIDIGV